MVIAVDLNSNIVSRRSAQSAPERQAEMEKPVPQFRNDLLNKLSDSYEAAENVFRQKINELLQRDNPMPDIFDTVITSINIIRFFPSLAKK